MSREGLRGAQWDRALDSPGGEGEGSQSGAEKLVEAGQPQPAWTSRALAHKSNALLPQPHLYGLHHSQESPGGVGFIQAMEHPEKSQK